MHNNKILVTFCSHCGKYVTHKQKYHGNGKCPKCNHKGIKRGVCDTKIKYLSYEEYDSMVFDKLIDVPKVLNYDLYEK